MKKIILFYLIIIIIIIQTGCKKYKSELFDIRDLNFIKIEGVDSIANIVQLTSVSESSKTTDGSKKVVAKMLYSNGRTIFEAIGYVNTYNDKKLFLGHLKHIIIGEETAKEGTQRLTDFFIRDHETRLNTNVFISKDSTAKEFIKTLSEQDVFMSDILETLVSQIPKSGYSTAVNLKEFDNMLDRNTSSAYLPCIQIIKSHKTDKESIANNIELAGLGIFENNKLKYYLDKEETKSFNMLNNEGAGIIILKDPYGKNITLNIINSKNNVNTYINDGIPSIEVNLEVLSNIVEQNPNVNTYNKKDLDIINENQKEEIKSSVENLIKKVQEMNTDILGFGDKLYRQHPEKWNKIKDDWNKVFNKIDIKVNIKTQLHETQAIT